MKERKGIGEVEGGRGRWSWKVVECSGKVVERSNNDTKLDGFSNVLVNQLERFKAEVTVSVLALPAR